MPDHRAPTSLQRRLEALQVAHPELDPLSALVLLGLQEWEAPGKQGMTTAVLSRRLGLEHALIRRAAAELETAGRVRVQPVGGASPALRLTLASAS